MSDKRRVSFERPLADDERLTATVELEGPTTWQPPSGWTLTADDLIETRCLSQSQSMRFPCDADTTRRLEWVIAGGQRLSLLRRLLRRITKTPKAHHPQ